MGIFSSVLAAAWKFGNMTQRRESQNQSDQLFNKHPMSEIGLCMARGHRI